MQGPGLKMLIMQEQTLAVEQHKSLTTQGQLLKTPQLGRTMTAAPPVAVTLLMAAIVTTDLQQK